MNERIAYVPVAGDLHMFASLLSPHCLIDIRALSVLKSFGKQAFFRGMDIGYDVSGFNQGGELVPDLLP